jgi:hypothetical protein
MYPTEGVPESAHADLFLTGFTTDKDPQAGFPPDDLTQNKGPRPAGGVLNYFMEPHGQARGPQ